MLYQISAAPEPEAERAALTTLSEGALARVWDNDEDAAYDDWRQLYGLSAQ